MRVFLSVTIFQERGDSSPRVLSPCLVSEGIRNLLGSQMQFHETMTYLDGTQKEGLRVELWPDR